jgi:hypothetical protein
LYKKYHLHTATDNLNDRTEVWLRKRLEDPSLLRLRTKDSTRMNVGSENGEVGGISDLLHALVLAVLNPYVTVSDC